MGQVQTKKTHGAPKAGTKVRYKAGGGLLVDTIVYVTDHPGTVNEIVVNTSPNQYHGQYCSEWELLTVSDELGLSEENKRALAEAARKAAKERGYCDEADNILRDLGILGPNRRRKVTVELEIEEDEGYQFYASNLIYTGLGAPHIRLISRNVHEW